MKADSNTMKRLAWLKRNKALWKDMKDMSISNKDMVSLAEKARTKGLYSEKTILIDVITGLRSKINKLKKMEQQ